jgi:hypothetical protein
MLETLYNQNTFQSIGNFKFLNDLPEVSVGCSAEGNKTVLDGTPSVSANPLLKNLSSALHQKGLFITFVPVAAFLGKHDKGNVLRNTVNDYCLPSLF